MVLPVFFSQKVANNRKTLRLNLQETCNKCDHKGYIETGDNMFVDCECVKTFYKLREYINCGLSGNDIYNEADLKSFPEVLTEKLNRMTGKINSYYGYNFFFYLINKLSYGTDIVSKYILEKFADNGFICYTITMKQLIEIFFDFENEKYNGCIDFLKSVQVLLITGMGQEYNSKMKTDDTFVVSAFSGFLAERKNKTTMLSATFTKDVLHSTYSKELVSLITKGFLGFGVESVERQETEYDIIRKKKLDIGFDDLDIIKPARKKIR